MTKTTLTNCPQVCVNFQIFSSTLYTKYEIKAIYTAKKNGRQLCSENYPRFNGDIADQQGVTAVSPQSDSGTSETK